MEETLDGSEVLETTETAEETTEVAAEETLTKEQIADLKAKAAKTEELEKTNKQLFERAKKAEELKKENKDALSNKDILYLAKSGIHDDDLDDVLEMAQLRKVSIQEAHKFMNPILKAREEERRTANATLTRGGNRGAATPTPEQVLSEAETGAEIEPTEENMQAIFRGRQDRRAAHHKR